ncbi:MAG: glycoside hydrolase family 99-like domain-containing protein [Planctomycetota bacterium]|nr:glycoside hydrolase family 99-like domain-containing protein [Planctomycetota bacterium]
MPKPYQVAAYYFPNYHVDPRNEQVHGKGWTEWELVKAATPRFPGHHQPNLPAWGFEDESDPKAMAKKIDAAADHGLTSFIFDWYYYNDGPFLERGLDNGFLRAPNNARMKFGLMWANHDWIDIHPAKHGGHHRLLYPGEVTLETWERITDLVIERYFKHPSYWLIDGAPYFSIYESHTLLKGFGGLAPTKAALARFRQKTITAGFPDLHLNGVVWGISILPNEKTVANPDQLAHALGFNSVTSYVWVHHVGFDKFPVTPYTELAAKAAAHWDKTFGEFTLPYHPNVTMGWDSSPRTVQSDKFESKGYPFMAKMGDNTPAAFEAALREARARLEKRPVGQRILTVNAWNEWTEGSYLEPDTVNGMKYLEAIKRVFG